MPNFEKSAIYKIVCNDPDITDTYIGSTTNFRQRKHLHKESCNNCRQKPTKLYEFINNHGGWDNWNMILVKEISCVDRAELNLEERKYIDEEKPSLNMRLAIVLESDKEKKMLKNLERANQNYEKNKGISWKCDECNQELKLSQKAYHQKCCGHSEDVKENIKHELNQIAKENYSKNKTIPWICDVCNTTLLKSQKYYHQKHSCSGINQLDRTQS